MSILKTHLKMHLYSWAFDPESGTDLTCYFYIVVLSISVLLFFLIIFNVFIPFLCTEKGYSCGCFKVLYN